MKIAKALATIAAVITATAAHAIDFETLILNEDGKPYTNCVRFDAPKGDQAAGPRVCAEEAQITLGQFVFDALNMPDQSVAATDVVARGSLALRIKSEKKFDLNDKERDLAKSVLLASVGKMGNRPVAVVQALRFIDPAAVK
jgi:hypothetical protein